MNPTLCQRTLKENIRSSVICSKTMISSISLSWLQNIKKVLEWSAICAIVFNVCSGCLFFMFDLVWRSESVVHTNSIHILNLCISSENLSNEHVDAVELLSFSKMHRTKEAETSGKTKKLRKQFWKDIYGKSLCPCWVVELSAASWMTMGQILATWFSITRKLFSIEMSHADSENCYRHRTRHILRNQYQLQYYSNLILFFYWTWTCFVSTCWCCSQTLQCSILFTLQCVKVKNNLSADW